MITTMLVAATMIAAALRLARLQLAKILCLRPALAPSVADLRRRSDRIDAAAFTLTAFFHRPITM
jgi:hypothetical protein